jgi:DNA-binding NarL/FixJ family response regulator
VVILDFHLQGGTGLQVLRAVRRMNPGIAFVVLSSHSSPTLRLDYVRAGADRFLDKATEFRQLASEVEHLSLRLKPT